MPKELPRSPDDTLQPPDHSLDSVIIPRPTPTPEQGIDLPPGFADGKREDWFTGPDNPLLHQVLPEEPKPKRVRKSGVAIRVPKSLFGAKAKPPEPTGHVAPIEETAPATPQIEPETEIVPVPAELVQPTPEPEIVEPKAEQPLDPVDMPPRFKRSPPKPKSPPYVFKPEPSAPAESETKNDTVESLSDQIEWEQRLLNRDKEQGLSVTAQGDEEKLKDLIMRRDALALAEKNTPAPVEPETVVPPIPTPEPEVVPAAPVTPEVFEPRSVNEVLALQKEAFSARREMIAFRHGKKVSDLSPQDQERYMELRQTSHDKRKEWLAQINNLTPEEQADLMGMTKLAEVENRLSAMTPEKIMTEALLAELAEKEKQLKIVEWQLGKYSATARRNISALNIEGETKELRARKRALLAQFAEIKEKLTGEGAIAPEAETPVVAEPSEPERDLAESKGRAREMLRSAINELSRRIDAISQRIAGMNSWNVWNRLQAIQESNSLIAQRQNLDDELNADKPGFGARFKEAASKAYRKLKNKFKGEEGAALIVETPETVVPALPTEAPMDLPLNTEPTPEPAAELAPQNEAEKKRKSWKGWLWERAKGMGTVGYWEFHQAENFRGGTKKAGQRANLLAEQIQKERNLSLEDALAEAEQIKTSLGGQEGLDDATSKKINKISNEITARKIVENDAKVGDIIVNTIAQLEDKLKKYKGVSGQDVLTEDAKNKIATELQGRLNGLRGAYIEADAKELTKMMRENLEPDWWKRYVYGGLELALATTAVYFGTQYLASKFAAAKIGGAGAKGAGEVALKDTIWAEAKRQLVTNGVPNPTDAQIQQIATKFCEDSGVKVMEGGKLLWSKTAGGTAIDTVLSKGFIVKIAGGLKQIALMHP